MIYFSGVRILPKGSHKSGGPINSNTRTNEVPGNIQKWCRGLTTACRTSLVVTSDCHRFELGRYTKTTPLVHENHRTNAQIPPHQCTNTTALMHKYHLTNWKENSRTAIYFLYLRYRFVYQSLEAVSHSNLVLVNTS